MMVAQDCLRTRAPLVQSKLRVLSHTYFAIGVHFGSRHDLEQYEGLKRRNVCLSSLHQKESTPLSNWVLHGDSPQTSSGQHLLETRERI